MQIAFDESDSSSNSLTKNEHIRTKSDLALNSEAKMGPTAAALRTSKQNQSIIHQEMIRRKKEAVELHK